MYSPLIKEITMKYSFETSEYHKFISGDVIFLFLGLLGLEKLMKQKQFFLHLILTPLYLKGCAALLVLVFA